MEGADGSQNEGICTVVSVFRAEISQAGRHIPVFIVDLVSEARSVNDGQLHFDPAFLYH